MLRRRILPTLAVFAATALVTGALGATVYGRGLAFTLGPLGAAAHVPALALQLALTRAALVRLKGLSPASCGLRVDAGDLRALAAMTAATALGLAVFVALTGALLGHPVGRSANPVDPLALLVALLSFVGSSAVQQVTTQSLALAASPGERVTLGGAAVAVAVFVLAHAQVSTAPVYLANVALFGAAAVALFAGGSRPSYAAPLGMHAGWNFAQVALLGAPSGDAANPIAPLRWPEGAPRWFGGAHGFDEGLLFPLALLPLLAWAARRRATAR